MRLKNVLCEIGMTEKESRIYLASLELGPSPASAIASRAKLNRVTTYDVLQKLILKGFISTHMQGKLRFFSATDPDVIRGDYEQKYHNFKEAIPELRRLRRATSHPKIRYYEGVEGVSMIYEDTLTSKTGLLNYADSRLLRKHFPNHDNSYVKKRVKKKIYLLGIAPRDEYGEAASAIDNKSFREIRLVPRTEFDFSNEIYIYNDKMAIISFGEDDVVGMIIENAEIAETQRAIFKMAWHFAARVQ